MDEMMFFRKNAILDGLCKEWDTMWAACHDDRERLMRLVMMQQSIPYFATYCHNGKGLSKEYFLDTFGDYINGYVFEDCDDVEGYTYGMYVNPPTGTIIDVDVAHLMWCDSSYVIIPETKCPKLYISNDSDVHIALNGYSLIHVYLFDNSKVTIDDADEDSDVVVYKYSPTCGVEQGSYCFATIKEFEKELRI